MLMRQTDGTNTIDFQYDAGGQIIGFVYNGTPYYYLRNIMNDVSGIVDANGTVVAKYRYDAYGNTIYSTGSMAEINPIRYRGYYFDAETSWYYLESRYYNPEWRRFINSDSLFIAGDAITGSNMYAYCLDNPIMYRDDSGAMPSLNEFFDFIEEPLWRFSKTIADTISSVPGVPDALAVASNDLLSRVTGFLDPENLNDFIKTTTGKIFTGVLDIGSHLLLAHIPSTTALLNFATGIRHLMPINMDFGAPWAGYFLNFIKDENGNYTSDPEVEMWQSHVGYTPTYDFFFSLGGPIFRDKYEFKIEPAETSGDPTDYYVVWIWKGDYWNLGAGAEIGIYHTSNEIYHENGFYDVDTNLKLGVDMTIIYDEEELNNLVQTNWWVCSFTPEKQLIDINDLEVVLKVRFADPSLREPFYDEWNYRNGFTENAGKWTEVTMITYPPYNDDNINDYQYEINY